MAYIFARRELVDSGVRRHRVRGVRKAHRRIAIAPEVYSPLVKEALHATLRAQDRIIKASGGNLDRLPCAVNASDPWRWD